MTYKITANSPTFPSISYLQSLLYNFWKLHYLIHYMNLGHCLSPIKTFFLFLLCVMLVPAACLWHSLFVQLWVFTRLLHNRFLFVQSNFNPNDTSSKRFLQTTLASFANPHHATLFYFNYGMRNYEIILFI